MNEQIEHCLYQAGLTAQGCWDELDDYARQGIEKFAELIVRECIDRIKNTTFLGDTKEWFEPSDVLWTAAQQVKQHFGVEE